MKDVSDGSLSEASKSGDRQFLCGGRAGNLGNFYPLSTRHCLEKQIY